MTKIIARPYLTVFLLVSVFYGSCSMAFSRTTDKTDLIIEKRCSDLDLENLVLAQDLAQCKQEQEAQALKARHLEDKISQLDDQNKRAQALVDQIAAAKEDNAKLVRLNARLQNDIEDAARITQKSLDEKAVLLVEARLEKDALLKRIKDLEAGNAAFQADHQRLLRINAQLEATRDVSIRRAKEIVQRHAKTFTQPYSRRSDFQKAVQALGSANTALKADNERLTKANVLLEEKSKDLFLQVNAIDYRAKGYDGLSHAMQKLNQQVVLLKKENDSLKTRLDALKRDMNKERASIYREMGAAAAQAGLVNEAINVYQLSLKLDPHDPMTHYYLGLLYSKQWHDADALLHFKKYLALVPMAENRKEVEYFMTIMLNRSDLAIK